jgi:hypothetical protein
MPDIRVIISAMNKASKDIDQVKKDIQGVKSESKDATPAVGGFGDKLKSMMGTAAAAAGALAAVGLAVKEVYDGIKEGAELEYAASRFDRLAEAAGTTADVLLGELKEATSGMISDSELMSSASDLMALGLADTSEEVIRLTTVAGALGMNMNQLVLTLTNQTTMRFDALGVSVAGFDEKVKALTDSGMSAQDAFSEAFLQQAEEQIEKVGSKAGTSAGQIQTMESAFKNLGDAIKLTTADALDGLAPVLTSLADHMTENVQVGQQFGDVIGDLKDLQKAGVISGKEYNAMLRDIGIHSGMGAVTTEQLAKAQEYLYQTIGYTSDGVITYTEAVQMGQAQLALMAAESESAASATESVRDATNDANAAMQRYTSSLLFKIASEGLSSEGAYRLAEAMGLVDKNTVAATKQTNVYKQMLDSGMISQRQYNALIADLDDKISNLPEGKELTVTANTEEVMTRLRAIEAFQFGDKPARVKYEVDDGAVRGYRPPTLFGTVNYRANVAVPRAVGGAVTGGNPYTWQEYGYRGELFIPSVDGFVLSRADAERALARALYGGESAIDPEAIGKAIAKALSGITTSSTSGGNVYNLTMPTSSNPADVRTAFELMEAWA